MSRTRRYSELIQLETFQERFDYLSLGGVVGVATFGFDRYLNQQFYRSSQWKRVRDHVIVRDGGCDLAVMGRELHTDLLVHHMNPMAPGDLERGNPDVLNPDYLITTCINTHNAIHYGDFGMLPDAYVERVAGDTKLW
jgi:hypothetical protein